MTTSPVTQTADNSTPSLTRLARRLDLTNPESLLRVALKADAIVSGANGIAYLAAASLLAGPIGAGSGELRAIGAFLVIYAAAVWTVGARDLVSPVAVRTVIGANIAWAVASIALVALGWGSLTTAGSVWVVLQAMTVAGFAVVQATALRRKT